MKKRWKCRMAKLTCNLFESSWENYWEAFDFGVLVNCSNQKKLKKLKEAILSVCKKEIF